MGKVDGQWGSAFRRSGKLVGHWGMLSDERGRLTDDGGILPNIREAVKVVGKAEKSCRRVTKWFDSQKKVVGTNQSGLSVRNVVWG